MRRHDGAPAHVCAPVRHWQNMAYSNCWIGLGRFSSTTVTIARSHTIGFFCLLGSVSQTVDITKELVFQDIVTTRTDLIARLYPACNWWILRCCDLVLEVQQHENHTVKGLDCTVNVPSFPTETAAMSSSPHWPSRNHLHHSTTLERNIVLTVRSLYPSMNFMASNFLRR
ncbi:hypothetical protein TNCV_310541 [Trichonephila clavipes]|nr:hypothetical protein TNCV_310541 [Trichonephila clavipes]